MSLFYYKDNGYDHVVTKEEIPKHINKGIYPSQFREIRNISDIQETKTLFVCHGRKHYKILGNESVIGKSVYIDIMERGEPDYVIDFKDMEKKFPAESFDYIFFINCPVRGAISILNEKFIRVLLYLLRKGGIAQFTNFGHFSKLSPDEYRENINKFLPYFYIHFKECIINRKEKSFQHCLTLIKK